MSPTQISAYLRRMAAKIDASKNPSRSLVAADLNKVLVAMGEVLPMEPEVVPGVGLEAAPMTEEEGQWPLCSQCRGEGCMNCGGSGTMEPAPVEDIAEMMDPGDFAYDPEIG